MWFCCQLGFSPPMREGSPIGMGKMGGIQETDRFHHSRASLPTSARMLQLQGKLVRLCGQVPGRGQGCLSSWVTAFSRDHGP